MGTCEGRGFYIVYKKLHRELRKIKETLTAPCDQDTNVKHIDRLIVKGAI